METYLCRFTYTSTSWADLLADPADRTAAIRTLADAAGCVLRSVHYCPDDLTGVVIVEAPDQLTGAAITVLTTASGAFASVTSQRIVAAQDFVAVIERARSMVPSYSPPLTTEP